MKNLLPLFLLLFSAAFCRGQDSIYNRIGHMICFTLRSEDSKEYLKICPTQNDYIEHFVTLKGEENRTKIAGYVNENYNENIFTEQFERIMKRGKELGILWHTTTFTKIICDTTHAEGDVFYKGDIWFTAGGKNWMIKFDDCYFANGKIDLYLFVPFYNKIPDNINRCSKYKDEYMARCIAGCKKSLEILPPDVADNFNLFKPSIEDYCLTKFNEYLPYDNCEEMIKTSVDWPHITKRVLLPGE